MLAMLSWKRRGAKSPSAGPPTPPLSPSGCARQRCAELVAFPQNVPPGSYVLVEVEDGGCGMTAEVLNQALDPFFTTKEVGQGTGLGLPVVFGIVQGHQGYLTIRSEAGAGTRTGLYLPRVARAAQEQRARPTEAGLVVEPEATPGYNILVIDDEEAVLDVVRRFLKIAGHTVTCATSGHEALELIGGGLPVDLVILDLMMPRRTAPPLSTVCANSGRACRCCCVPAWCATMRPPPCWTPAPPDWCASRSA